MIGYCALPAAPASRAASRRGARAWARNAGCAHHLDRGDRRHAGDRVAAVGAAHAAGMGGVHDLGAPGRGADRHAGAERLGGDDDVGARCRSARGRTACRCGRSRTAPRRRSSRCRAACTARGCAAGSAAAPARSRASPCTGSMMIAATAAGIDLRDERLLELRMPQSSVLLVGHPGRARGRRCGIGRRTMSDANGPKPFLNRLYLLVRREREQRAAVVAAFEADDAGPPGVRAASLTAFSTASAPLLASSVFLGNVAGRELVEQLAQADVRLVGGDQRRMWMQRTSAPAPHGLDHRRRAVADGQHADAAGEVDERVAVDVVDERAVGALDDDLGGLAEPVRHRRRPPRQHRLFGPGTSVFGNRAMCHSFTVALAPAARDAPGTSLAASSTISTL